MDETYDRHDLRDGFGTAIALIDSVTRGDQDGAALVVASLDLEEARHALIAATAVVADLIRDTAALTGITPEHLRDAIRQTLLTRVDRHF